MLSLTIHIEPVMASYELRVAVRDHDVPFTRPYLVAKTYTLPWSTDHDDHDEVGTLLEAVREWAVRMTAYSSESTTLRSRSAD